MSQRFDSTLDSETPTLELTALADELGIVREYVDGFGEKQCAPRTALLHMLAALGYPVTTERGAAIARFDREQERVSQGIAPVLVAWGGSLDRLDVWCDNDALGGAWQARIHLEDGRALSCGGALGDALATGKTTRHAVRVSLPFGVRLPLGYHRIELSWGKRHAETLVVAAPRRAPRGPKKSWGVFAPVYALRGQTGLGSGTLAELTELCDLVRDFGGDFVATLPMMAQFLDRPFDTSPFAPASRLFWNEMLLDLSMLPELGQNEEASRLFHSESFRRELSELEQSPFVQPGRQIRLVHALLEPLARQFFAYGGDTQPGFRAFVRGQPYASEYALFRAVTDAHNEVHAWPETLKKRALRSDDCDPGRYAMHLYAQWQMNVQLTAASSRARTRGMRLYMDLPVGVHSASFDMWREPECFVPGVSVGAPRDALCTDGQDWGFAPAHPEGQQAQSYRYFISYVRSQLKHAGILRIDHVMGLHRIFCVPHGTSAREGLYLKQPHDELYAILTLEAAKSGSVLVGEDLGTVPDEVRTTMRQHGMKRMFVLPFEVDRDDKNGPTARRVPTEALATINTHDMPTFAGLWRAHDIEERQGRGVLSAADALKEHADRRELLVALLAALGLDREATREEALRAAVHRLGHSQAELVQLTLEDLWGEIEPQNVPGTFDPERNFCRRMRYRLEVLPRLAQVRTLLSTLNHARHDAESQQDLSA